MQIAPDANPFDGLIEFVRWGPIGRLDLLRNLPRLYDGSHTQHPLCERKAVRRVEFNVPEPVDVMIDGEVLTLKLASLDILPGALDVYI
jgi:diacylglycerol kinase (ATP)